MFPWKNYVLAESLPQALELLAESPGLARPVAGGTDLLLDIQQGRHAPLDTLVDISRIPEMTFLGIRHERLIIGAAVPLNKIIASKLVNEHAMALMEAASLIGGAQVRNTATLGGNVAHALPAGDGSISLLALDAGAEIADSDGSRFIPVEGIYSGPGRSVLDPRKELLVAFHLPLRDRSQGSAFRRIMRPQGVAIAIINLGVWLERRGERVEAIRIAVGPAGPTPFRARSAESCLRGQTLSRSALEQARAALLSEVRFRTSPHRSSREYRLHLAGDLLEEVVSTAWERAG
jgi:carbon-monoxide dehydrogenase medium subunit